MPPTGAKVNYHYHNRLKTQTVIQLVVCISRLLGTRKPKRSLQMPLWQLRHRLSITANWAESRFRPLQTAGRWGGGDRVGRWDGTVIVSGAFAPEPIIATDAKMKGRRWMIPSWIKSMLQGTTMCLPQSAIDGSGCVLSTENDAEVTKI